MSQNLPVTSQRAPKPDRDAALRVARRRFLDCQRFDVSAMADELGVNRITLYRWFGSRDQYLVETVWTLTSAVLDTIDAQVSARGATRVIEIASRFLSVILGDPGMQHWLSVDGEQVMRLCTRHDMGYQPRLIAAFEDVIGQEVTGGALSVPINHHELAFVIVRLIETYTYLDLITGEPADAARLAPVLQLLLSPYAEH